MQLVLLPVPEATVSRDTVLTELEEAALANDAALVESILQRPQCPDPPGEELAITALHIASCEGYVEIARLLLEATASPDRISGMHFDDAETPLESASRKCRPETVELLLGARANPNKNLWVLEYYTFWVLGSCYS